VLAEHYTRTLLTCLSSFWGIWLKRTSGIVKKLDNNLHLGQVRIIGEYVQHILTKTKLKLCDGDRNSVFVFNILLSCNEGIDLIRWA
jgi:hypothetical protein